MNAKKTVAKNPTTVHWLYSSPMTLKVNSAPHAISIATTIKFKATCTQNSWVTLDFLVVSVMIATPFFFGPAFGRFRPRGYAASSRKCLSRSTFLSTLPTEVSGSSLTIATRSGIANFEMTPLST